MIKLTRLVILHLYDCEREKNRHKSTKDTKNHKYIRLKEKYINYKHTYFLSFFYKHTCLLYTWAHVSAIAICSTIAKSVGLNKAKRQILVINLSNCYDGLQSGS